MAFASPTNICHAFDTMTLTPRCADLEHLFFPRLSVYNKPGAFLNVDSLVLEVYKHLPLLIDVLAWRATNTRTHKVGSEVVSTWLARIVKPFVQMYIPELCHTMHVTRAIITGSCTRQMLSGDDSPVDNLNIVVTNGGFDLFHTLIENTLLYEWVHRSTKPHYVFDSSAQRFARFKFRDLYITIMEAKIDGLFKVVLCSPTTADMLFMTAGGFGMLYPEWTLNNITVVNWMILRGNQDYDKVRCICHNRFVCNDDTSFMTGACRQLCPTQWRYISDFGETLLVVDWDARFSLRSMIRTSHMIWRLAEHCHNSSCPYNPTNNTQVVVLPPIPIPCDLATIQVQEAHIDNHTLHYADRRLALLYVTLATIPHLVSVPLHDGASRLTNLSQLETSHWLDHLKRDKFIVLTGCLQKTFNTLPEGPDTPWDHGYTIICEDPWMYPPPNALICDMACITDVHDDVTGNVLVIKHKKGNKHDIVDMTKENANIVDSLIRSAIHASNL
ncbi:hypothetical protein BDR03DRAFT_1009017 [Suillus americanus]|nr:hypothetical protein BDR03DRAFT_1009017 [Suillus americanus]